LRSPGVRRQLSPSASATRTWGFGQSRAIWKIIPARWSLTDAIERRAGKRGAPPFRALDRYHDDASFSAWMILILTNKIYAIKLQTRSRCQFEVAGSEEAVLASARKCRSHGERQPSAGSLQPKARKRAPHKSRAIECGKDEPGNWEALHDFYGWIGHLKSISGTRVTVTSPAVSASSTAASDVSR